MKGPICIDQFTPATKQDVSVQFRLKFRLIDRFEGSKIKGGLAAMLI